MITAVVYPSDRSSTKQKEDSRLLCLRGVFGRWKRRGGKMNQELFILTKKEEEEHEDDDGGMSSTLALVRLFRRPLFHSSFSRWAD